MFERYSVNKKFHSIIDKENRIYIRGELLEKIVKIVSILQLYYTYLCYITFWALEYHFIENLKLILKENQIMKGWFHN